MLPAYRSVLTTPGVVVPLLASFAGAALIGTLDLAVLLSVRLETGSFPIAGLSVGAIGIGNAIGIVIQGNLIDRRGQTAVLLTASAICLTALFALVTVLQTVPHLTAVLLALAFLAGAAVPATPSSIRVLMTDLISEAHLRPTGYSLVAVTFTAAGVVAPLLVSASLVVMGPTAAVALCGTLAGLTGTVFAATKASRAWHPPAHETRGSVLGRRPTGLATAGMRTLVGTNAVVGVATGLTNVGIPAAAIAAGRPAWAGILFSCAAVGNLIGGVVYGGRAWRPRLAAQLLMTLIGAAITATLTGIATGSLIALAATLLLSGVAGSIRGIIMSTLLDHVGAPDAATESYASMVSTGLLGSALGSAIGGAVIGSSNAQIALLAAASLGWITAASFLSRIRTMHPDPFRRRQH